MPSQYTTCLYGRCALPEMKILPPSMIVPEAVFSVNLVNLAQVAQFRPLTTKLQEEAAAARAEAAAATHARKDLEEAVK